MLSWFGLVDWKPQSTGNKTIFPLQVKDEEPSSEKSLLTVRVMTNSRQPESDFLYLNLAHN